MDLILWRHAEAVPERDDLPDLERPLTSKGERHAARMADWLNHRLAHSTRILVSPALRCQQTAQALGVGHQPTLGQAAALLLAGVVQPWAIKKGAVWWLRNRDRENGSQVVLHLVTGPDGV